EPHVAETIFTETLDEQKIAIISNERLKLDKKTAVIKKAGNIHTIVMESGRQLHGHIFIDATYEGDLMAMAGVSYTVGRESNATHNETQNGVRLWEHQY